MFSGTFVPENMHFRQNLPLPGGKGAGGMGENGDYHLLECYQRTHPLFFSSFASRGWAVTGIFNFLYKSLSNLHK